MKNFCFWVVIFLFSVFFSSQALFAESYEDYRKYRGSSNASDIKAAKNSEPWGIYDGLRSSIKDAVDEGLVDPDSIENSDLDKAIRKIVREEIENALRKERKKYSTAGVFEIGGYISAMFHAPYYGNSEGGDKGATTNVILTSGVMNFFPVNNLAFSLKSEGEFDIKHNQQFYNLGVGPMFALGLDSANTIALYFALYYCVTINSFLDNKDDKFGWRYVNELGLKFGIGRVIVNVGFAVGFDGNQLSSSNFSAIINPMIGITAWF